jgi:hypothetical protein
MQVKDAQSNMITVMNGTISKDYDNGRISRQFSKNMKFIYEIGLFTGVPCLFEPLMQAGGVKYFSEYLSEWIDSKKLLSLSRIDDGTFLIYAQIHPEPMSHYVTKIIYDTNKGGIITDYKILLSYSKESGDGILYSHFKTATNQNSHGDWVPVKTTITIPLMKYDFEISYENFELLSNMPKDSFAFHFPDGTFVDDFISKTYYKVGDIYDEDAAIDRFIERYGLTGNIQTKPVIYTIYIRYIFMGVGILMIIISVILYIRKWWLK